MAAKIYYDDDADLSLLKDKTIAILGYGSQGHAQAQNLRDSGLNVVVGQRPGSANYALAVEHGFEPLSIEDATRAGDLVNILLPDEVQGDVFREQIRPNLETGNVLLCSHGFNIHFGQVVPPEGVDAALVAPKGPGHLVRDLFGEQAVLCGGVSALVKAAYDTLVEAGYQPEMAYFECMHELKLIVDLFYQGGLNYMRYSVSNTAEYGDYTRGPRIVTEETKAEMKKILKEIQDGQFALEWMLENKANQPTFQAKRRNARNHPIEQVGLELRRMMTWIDSKEV